MIAMQEFVVPRSIPKTFAIASAPIPFALFSFRNRHSRERVLLSTLYAKQGLFVPDKRLNLLIMLFLSHYVTPAYPLT
jgi:hypothetical protein